MHSWTNDDKAFSAIGKIGLFIHLDGSIEIAVVKNQDTLFLGEGRRRERGQEKNSQCGFHFISINSRNKIITQFNNGLLQRNQEHHRIYGTQAQVGEM